ncbi:hypothetical protein LB559_09355 [Mesorhizobium sp. BR1-1-3]|uniref:hypothetical protein n=1 Tax=Mesorhizobium sp. BR1-1-3 TaxID=2876651 RepID=UPI001CD06680|nr:hypothetical protein [Mesorhizobium sp. BR1-1-3]MBZ9888145.1 hypothetical protein [Mesorhizobium sp. BR1-1-3]
MIIALAIVAGLTTLGAGIFAVFALGGFVLEFCMGSQWWATPAWMAIGFMVLVPMLFGSFALSVYAFFLISGVHP